MGGNADKGASRAASSDVRQRVAAYAILAAGIALPLLVYWPGLLDPDAVATLAQARSGWIGDHRSALGTWVWREAWLALGAGPGFFFVPQIVASVGGLYLVLRAALRRVAAAVATVVTLWSPWTLGFVGSIGRDMWFVSACLLALGLAIGSLRWPRRVAIAAVAVGFALTVVATASRQNGVTAVLPIAVALTVAAVRLLPQDSSIARLSGVRAAVAAVMAGLVVTAAGLAVTVAGTSAVTRVEEHPEVYTQVWDLGYMTVKRGERMIPPLPRAMQPVQTEAEVAERWSPTTSLYMRFDRTLTKLPELYDEAAAETLSDAWRTAIEEHPLLYLRGRFGLWTRQLGIGDTPWHTYIDGMAGNEFGYDDTALPGLTQAAVDYARFWSVDGDGNGFIYRAWLFLGLCGAGLVLLARRFPLAVRMIGLLAAAGITSQLGLFLLAPSVQWRYQLLTVYAGAAVACVVVKAVARARAGEPVSAAAGRARSARLDPAID
ncbi:hypothetical protein Q5424_18575 [Conexibacter sp. JD483]|uniref:hypothetical protein n=1 Tax=unclassified Conexibacter TaxID=2627773 RepID=UPI002721A22D|nr:MULTISPECIES: hypothetical protein [unclassified Conexibacter]MDO8184077.1 hypothetical protein [Conexibacter sp. CPCC 205706]MDO8197069.1 hypothetical protein [Conexibacter sp. CPCC 205762]MDR9371108.1 hypothetical protein [Conexibacter sp. JD483]